jgi:tripartite-type tricarboxylate transporter receptor subunit TctC
MQGKRYAVTAYAAVAVAVAVMSMTAGARAADFYHGKTLSVLINYTAGGPTDVEGRLVARHLAKHIPGAPDVIVRNMAGAAGVVGINWLGEVAPHDGLTVAYFTGAASKSVIGESGIRTDLAKYAFVAAGPGVTVTYVRSDVPPGMKVPADIMKASNFWAGGLSPDSDKDIRERMQLDMLGIKYHYISNYPGSAEARLALERQEIQLFPESMPTYRSAIEPGLVKPGTVIPLWHDPLDDGEHFTASPDADGIAAKTFTDFLIDMKGGLPSGDMWNAFRLINSVGTTFLRVVVMPPDTPPDAVRDMKAAFAALNEDSDFRADALKTVKFVPRYLVDTKTEQLFRSKLTPDQGMRDFIHRYVEQGRAMLGK